MINSVTKLGAMALLASVLLSSAMPASAKPFDRNTASVAAAKKYAVAKNYYGSDAEFWKFVLDHPYWQGHKIKYPCSSTPCKPPQQR